MQVKRDTLTLQNIIIIDFRLLLWFIGTSEVRCMQCYLLYYNHIFQISRDCLFVCLFFGSNVDEMELAGTYLE